MTKRKIGLLVMAYGTPNKLEDLERYYTHIRRGRPPSEELLEELRSRYEAIGGISPLARITIEQAEALEVMLNESHPYIEFRMYIGLKHIEPFIEDAVQAMKRDGINEAVSLILAPHFSTFNAKSYNGRAQAEAARINGPVIHFIESWYKEPLFINYWSERIKLILNEISDLGRDKTVLIVSAHSLPKKIVAAGDPYPKQLEETAALISSQSGIANVAIGWQSAGRTPDPWLGPDIKDLTRKLFKEQGYTSYIYAPVGFVADHLEVLYDNDYECKVVTNELGATYFRPEMPNSNPKFIEALMNVILKKIKEVGE